MTNSAYDINLERLAEQYPDATKELYELTEALSAKQLQRKGIVQTIRKLINTVAL